VEIVNVHPAKGEADKYVLGPRPTLRWRMIMRWWRLVKGINPETLGIDFGWYHHDWHASCGGIRDAGKNYLDELLKRMNVTQPSELKTVRGGDTRGRWRGECRWSRRWFRYGVLN